MSSKTRTRKTRTTASTTGTAPTLRSVPEPTVAAKVHTDTEDKLWEALHANPNSTAAELSTAAKIGKSTAQKILVRWAVDGSVTRTAGIAEGGRRAADLWVITEIDTQDDPTPVDAPAAEDADTTDTTQTEPVTPDTPDADADTVPEEDPVEQTDTAADDAQNPVKPEAADLVPAADDAATDGDKPTEDGADATLEKKTRLAPGGLRGMVEDHLRDHPGKEFSPVEIARVLGGKSTGAVSNALDKLVEGGVAAQTQDKPKRFALAPAEHEAGPTPKN